MFGLYNLAGFSYWISSFLNYFFTSILCFFLNKYFTFKVKKWTFKMVVFFIVNIFGCYFIAYGIAKPLIYKVLVRYNQTMRDNAALFFGMCLFTMLNYLGQRFVVFRKIPNIKPE
jgi:putative flippase GtrA